ncbi:MAG TPA: hypothetical protein VM101_04515 [Flavitalea sp.]|nr:hypothetical protein [Flavitalea sp.]
MLVLQSLNSQLCALKKAFDEAIMQGNSFSDVKKIYRQIKKVEEQIKKRGEFLQNSHR